MLLCIYIYTFKILQNSLGFDAWDKVKSMNGEHDFVKLSLQLCHVPLLRMGNMHKLTDVHCFILYCYQ